MPQLSSAPEHVPGKLAMCKTCEHLAEDLSTLLCNHCRMKLPDNVNLVDNPAVKPSEVGEFKDFGDMFTMEDVIEGWSVDTVGVRDPTVEAVEFMELQEAEGGD